MEKIKESFERNLDLSLSRITEIRGERVRKFGWMLTIVFGLTGAGGMASELVAPTWAELGLWVPESENLQNVFFYSLAVLTVTAVVASTCVLLKAKSDD